MADSKSSLPVEAQGGCYPAWNNAESPTMPADSESWILSSKRLGNVRVPIRVKLSIAITVIVCLTILILSFTILARQKDQLYSQTVEKGKVSLNYFATNANIPLLNDDIVRLNRLIKDAASVEGILYAAIVDRKNMIKAHIDPDKIGKTLQTFKKWKKCEKTKILNILITPCPREPRF